MTAPTPPRPSTTRAAPAQAIPIRIVPRAALDALVARLLAGDAVPASRPSEAS
jgi:hypothetical protein